MTDNNGTGITAVLEVPPVNFARCACTQADHSIGEEVQKHLTELGGGSFRHTSTQYFAKEEIYPQFLPHGEGIQFVDGLFVDPNHVTGIFSIDIPLASYEKNHFPGKPMVPGFYILESMNQGGAAFLLGVAKLRGSTALEPGKGLTIVRKYTKPPAYGQTPTPGAILTGYAMYLPHIEKCEKAKPHMKACPRSSDYEIIIAVFEGAKAIAWAGISGMVVSRDRPTRPIRIHDDIVPIGC